MAKKGATQAGTTAGRKRGQDQAMAALLDPAPTSWRRNPEKWPYHNNLGTSHHKQKGKS